MRLFRFFSSMPILALRQLLFVASLVFAGAALIAPLCAQSAPPRELVLTVGKSLVLNTSAPIERVAVGFGDVAEARAVGPQEVLIDAKAAGETSLIIWQQGGSKLFFDVVVRQNTSNLTTRLETLRETLEEQLPGQQINVSLRDGNVFLSGTAKDMTTAERAVAIASTVGKVVNLLYVQPPPSEAQVLLKVQFAIVDRSVSTQLGLNLISTGATNTIGRATTGQFAPPDIEVDPEKGPIVTLTDALNFFLLRPDLNLGATIRALQRRGLFEILAEPNVLAINGKQASFLAGGEFPYPILQGGGAGVGTVTIRFREFGVRINFLPLVTPRGTIRLDVAPEVSALDFTQGLTFQGVTIPGLTTRRVQTEIELESGQSFAIGGLLDRRVVEQLQKVPLLSSVPVLGKLFQSKALDKQNNELLVIVTPEIVRPMPENMARPRLEFPAPLWGNDTVPRTPGVAATGPATVKAAEPIPVETLTQSIKDQSGMKLEGRDLLETPGIVPLFIGTPVQTPSATGAPSAPSAPTASPNR